MSKIRSVLVGAIAIAAISSSAALAAEKYSITFHTGSVGGLYMEPSVIFAEQWKKEIPEAAVAPILGGAMTNPLKVSATPDANSVLGWTTLPLANDALRGQGDFATRAPKGLKNLRALFRVNNLTFTIIVARGEVVPDGVTTVGQLLALKPKIHWALKTKGSGAESLSRMMFELYGTKYEELQSWGKVSFNNTSDAANMIIDGHADVFINAMPMPDSSVLTMDASLKNLKWLSMDEKQIATLASQYGYIGGELPTGSYASLKPGVRSVAYDHLVFAPEGMDEELAYKLTKTILANPKKVQALPSFDTFDPKVAGTDTVFPLHPGAKRAYQELGLPSGN